MLDKKALNVLKRMTESFGPPGFERETTQIINEYMKEYCDEVLVDKLGSIVFIAKGKPERPHMLLAGHVDEVGFVVAGIDEKTGCLSFNLLGGWWDQVLLSQRVVVRTERGDLHGVIAAKPPHLLTNEERSKVVEKKSMYIDVGASSGKDAAKAGVKIGDPIVPWSPFSIIRSGKIAMGKAFDDRVGAFVMMEMLRRIKEKNIKHPGTIYGAATVQEEVGLRGAQTVASLVDPDIAIVFEVDISGDIPGIKPFEAPAKMGKGPSFITYDRSMIPNQPLKKFILQTVKKAKLPIQLSQTAAGGTDAGRIHLHRIGCPSAVIGVPTRHIHSHVGFLNLEDLENAVKVGVELVKRLDQKMVDSFTAL